MIEQEVEKEEFLESGLLEVYIMGLSNTEEAALVERMLEKYPELYDEKNAIELTLEDAAFANPIEPNPALFGKISNQIFQKENTSQEPKQESKLLVSPNRKGSYWNPLSMAASIGLVVCLSAIFYLYQQNKELHTASTLAKVEEVFLKGQVEELQKAQVQSSNFTNSIGQVGTRQIVLVSTQQKASKAIVFWNPENHKVWLVNAELPELPKDKQYQLWGIVGGKPTDAGVFDANPNASIAIELKSISKPQAFAVTIENRGGSASPTLSTLCLQASL